MCTELQLYVVSSAIFVVKEVFCDVLDLRVELLGFGRM